jgi:hypothetical protein
MVGHRARADKCDVGDVWVGGQVLCDLGPTVYRLHNVGRMSAGDKGAGCNGGKIGGGPGSGLGTFYYDGVAGEDGGYYGGYQIMKLETLVPSSSRRRNV